ncbi:GAF and ANTAR domain-containing protein [Modestobacter versicolor]|uniref:Antitermination regulator n=1 Tax=Modestobacter versicolor TaxID=429133 RepID=A0A323V996_9ACTN|nr:GAF and ANTAR domain-containing protein [Modestobacter versicolor]MBB3676064.1 GAF domain-containing protein [Modestobacter versicolor]PZA21417.1 antitermination regulator [Modestobacter versicolor]
MTTDERTQTMPATEAFERLGSMSLSAESLESVLQAVADLTKQVLPGDVEASVSVLVADKPATFVHTGQLALDLDESQYGRGHGPCLQAAASGELVEVADARTESRWADYMRRAVELGSLSSLSVPLGSSEVLAAGLNIYARQPGAFDDDAVRRTAARFARFAGAAAANMHAYQHAREMADNLQVALQSRATIDQAKGILVERHRITPDQAFHLLARASMAANRKLRDVAEHLVATGELLASPQRR